MTLRKAIVTDEHREEARLLRAIWDSTPHETQAVFGEKFGIGNQSSVGQFLSGKVPLSMKAAQGFAAGLNCPVRAFSPRIAAQMDALVLALDSARERVEAHADVGTTTSERAAAHFSGALVPVVGRDDEGNLPQNVWAGGPEPALATGEFARIGSSEPFSFAVEVFGINMVPRYQPGEYMLVEPRSKLDIEDDVLVRTGGSTLLRRLASEPTAEVLQFTSYNDAAVLSIPRAEVAWMYHVAHPIPSRKIFRL